MVKATQKKKGAGSQDLQVSTWWEVGKSAAKYGAIGAGVGLGVGAVVIGGGAAVGTFFAVKGGLGAFSAGSALILSKAAGVAATATTGAGAVVGGGTGAVTKHNEISNSKKIVKRAKKTVIANVSTTKKTVAQSHADIQALLKKQEDAHKKIVGEKDTTISVLQESVDELNEEVKELDAENQRLEKRLAVSTKQLPNVRRRFVKSTFASPDNINQRRQSVCQ